MGFMPVKSRCPRGVGWKMDSNDSGGKGCDWEAVSHLVRTGERGLIDGYSAGHP